MNLTIISGYIGQDATVKQQGNQSVINFSVAVTDRWKVNGEKKEKTTWFSVSRWIRPEGDGIAKHLLKGTRIEVTGKVEADSYTDSSGAIKSILRLRADHIEFAGGSEKAHSNNGETINDEKTHDAKVFGDLPF